jgi:hypothetical protein
MKEAVGGHLMVGTSVQWSEPEFTQKNRESFCYTRDGWMELDERSINVHCCYQLVLNASFRPRDN